MALSTASSTRSAQRLTEEILQQLDAMEAQAQTLAAIRTRVQQYEIAYSLSSANVRAAIHEFRLAERHDICCWLVDYEARLRAGNA